MHFQNGETNESRTPEKVDENVSTRQNSRLIFPLGLLLVFGAVCSLYSKPVQVEGLDQEKVQRIEEAGREKVPQMEQAGHDNYNFQKGLDQEKLPRIDEDGHDGDGLKKGLHQEKVQRIEEDSQDEGKLEGCVWAPAAYHGATYQDSPCTTLLTARILASYSVQETTVPPLRWLFMGDSTVNKLFKHGRLDRDLTPRQAACRPDGMVCYQRSHERCGLNRAFGFPAPPSWRPPNFTLGEGPMGFSQQNANCQDCSGCRSRFAVCQHNPNATGACGSPSATQQATNTTSVNVTSTTKPELYGGYFSIEFARDVEIQTPTYDTKQENVAAFFQENYNNDPWLLEHFGGPPICVVSTGIHDMAIPNITLAAYLVNVEWFLELLMVPCGHVVWLQNTAPVRVDEKDPRWGDKVQTQANILEWNQAVHHTLNASHHLPLGKLTIVDVFEASVQYPHRDNIHLIKEWYIALGDFFRQAGQYIIASGSLAESE